MSVKKYKDLYKTHIKNMNYTAFNAVRKNLETIVDFGGIDSSVLKKYKSDLYKLNNFSVEEKQTFLSSDFEYAKNISKDAKKIKYYSDKAGEILELDKSDKVILTLIHQKTNTKSLKKIVEIQDFLKENNMTMDDVYINAGELGDKEYQTLSNALKNFNKLSSKQKALILDTVIKNKNKIVKGNDYVDIKTKKATKLFDDKELYNNFNRVVNDGFENFKVKMEFIELIVGEYLDLGTYNKAADNYSVINNHKWIIDDSFVLKWYNKNKNKFKSEFEILKAAEKYYKNKEKRFLKKSNEIINDSDYFLNPVKYKKYNKEQSNVSSAGSKKELFFKDILNDAVGLFNISFNKLKRLLKTKKNAKKVFATRKSFVL